MPMTRIKEDAAKPLFGTTFRVKLADSESLTKAEPSLVKADYSANDPGLLTGYFSTFDNADSVGDVIRKGAFTKTLKERKPRVLWYHDPTQPIGVVVDAWEDQKGLFGVIKLNLDTQKGLETYNLYKSGAMDSFSIGFQLEKFEVISTKNGDKAYDIKEVRLFEVSAVTFPANDQAVVSEVKDHYEELVTAEAPATDEKASVDEFGDYLDQLIVAAKADKPTVKLMAAIEGMIAKREADDALIADYLFGNLKDK